VRGGVTSGVGGLFWVTGVPGTDCVFVIEYSGPEVMVVSFTEDCLEC